MINIIGWARCMANRVESESLTPNWSSSYIVLIIGRIKPRKNPYRE
jgi:hypothetical protein